MCLNPVYIKGQFFACGQCMECLISRSNEWAYRCSLEASLYEKNCMITLTYNEDNCPKDNRLVKQDLQKFIKRLRRIIEPSNFKYFACGEYGDLKGRPHYHIIIFGWRPDDEWFFAYDKKGNVLNRSNLIEKEWTFGFSSICDVEFDTCKYVAIYLQKKHDLSDDRPSPFTLMSRGLGYGAFKPSWIITDKVYYNGKYIRLPRYYRERCVRENPLFQVYDDNIREKRKNTMAKYQIIENGTLIQDSKLYLEDVKKRKNKFKRIFGKNFFEKS